MTEFATNMFRALPYMGAAFAAMFMLKVFGPVEYQEGLTWVMVTAPIWATYIFVVTMFALILIGAAATEKFSDYLTDRREDGKLDE